MFTRNESIPLNIHDQTDHWKRNYNRLHHVDFTVVEFVLRVNQLESMTAGPYEVAKNFTANLVNGFAIGENNVRVGLVIYGTSVYPTFDLNDSFNKAVILNWIRDVRYYGGSSYCYRKCNTANS